MGRQSKANRRRRGLGVCPKCGRAGVHLQSAAGCGPCTAAYLAAFTATRLLRADPGALRGFLDALSPARSVAVKNLLRAGGVLGLVL